MLSATLHLGEDIQISVLKDAGTGNREKIMTVKEAQEQIANIIKELERSQGVQVIKVEADRGAFSTICDPIKVYIRFDT